MNQATKVNETIIKIVRELHTVGNPNMAGPDKTPLKRTFSPCSLESSMDEGTPLKRLKRESTLNLSCRASPMEVNHMRHELRTAKATVLDLEHRIQQMHNARKAMEEVFDSETKSLKRQHEYDRKTIEELEDHLQTVRRRETAVKLELSEIKAKYEQLKVASDEEIMALEKEIADLKNDSHCANTEGSIESFKLKRKIEELQYVLHAAEADAEVQKKLAAELAKQLNEKNSTDIELEQANVELQKAKNQIRQLKMAKEDYLEAQQQAKSQAHKLAKFAEMEKENAQLKEDFARLKDNLKNKLLLEEEVHDLKNRLTKSKELEKRAAELRAKCDQNEMYLSEWKAVARGFCETTESDAVLPHLLRSAIERLQQQELSLTAEKVDFEGQLKSAQLAAKLAQSQLDKHQKHINDLKSTGEAKQTLIHRLQKKLLLISRERDSYRLQLDSYERDLTMVASCNDGAEPGSSIAQRQKERIDSLEKIIDGYRDLLAKLESDLQEAQPQLYAESVPVRQQQLSRLQDDVAKLRHENEQLREARDKLEIQLESLSEGQDIVSEGQVVHLASNPFSEGVGRREQQLEQLKEENLRLKSKLKKMEEGIETSKLGDVSICPKEVQALKEQIKNNEKQTQRLKDYFKTSMQDFRNVIYMLFGYKIDRPSNSSIYKLRNMYAESADNILCFEVNQEGDLNLLENEFSATLGSMIDLHLIHQNSIPVFLSAITMDLFHQKTIT
ncbi:mitotic spindle assembly checkpoint protein MAD1 [Dendroctonus ponderosae]|uniref:mitotic spindle assembly checkpoint protein MAD1 n=1 Tax=Dendroctonus ponderosae TaxID=77166 RepID=UPI0020363D50|nr:mitotic spindle assembly checkpoint protein MAD1 [Dendroctonus ponderosae]